MGGFCICNDDWIGDSCEIPCLNGTNDGSGVCVCEPCFDGVSCESLCNGNGDCDTENNNGTCVCDFYGGYKREFCDKHECPGWPENCMGHGTCHVTDHLCECDPGYKGMSLKVFQLIYLLSHMSLKCIIPKLFKMKCDFSENFTFCVSHMIWLILWLKNRKWFS